MSRFIRSSIGCVVAGTAIFWCVAGANADDAFFDVPISSLKITAGDLPKSPAEDYYAPWDFNGRFITPRVVPDGDVEAYPSDNVSNNSDPWSRWRPETESLLLRAPAGKDVTGTLYVVNQDWTGLKKVKFLVPASSADASKREAFYKAKEAHYRQLMVREFSRSPWFRFQMRQAQAAVARKSLAEFDANAARQPTEGVRNTQFEDTYQLLSGGKAVSENLQLERLLPLAEPQEATVDIESLRGITIAEMDWGPLTNDINPQLDPLAATLPADQHALLFPSFNAMLRLMDEAALNGTPILEAAQPRSESARSRERYEKQLCLSVNALSRLLGDKVVASVAFTGSDPYLRTGTDVAIVFEAKNAVVLKTHVATQQAAAVKANADCKPVEGTIGDVKYTGAASPDRSVCSYLAQVGDAVVVTNSLYQLQRFIDTSAGRSESLASLPEYRFFRHRYERNGDETGLRVVTDKAIRRWCSAKWRIATSRRTRAAAILSHYQAQFINDLVTDKVEPHDVQTILQVPDLGTLRLTKNGMTSSTYGTLDFQTPIAELDFTKVTKGEADSYERWRQTYQQNWRQFFDPIACRFAIRDDRLSADLTVMPLIDSSEYRHLVAFGAGIELKPTSGDPHLESLLHFTMAINSKSQGMKQLNDEVEGPLKVGLISWLGESVSLYSDSDSFWKDLAEAVKPQSTPRDANAATEKFFRENLHRLPIAINAEVSNGLKLSLFLSGLRAYIEQTAPQMLTWTSHEHNGQPYVSITPTERGRQAVDDVGDKFALYYSPSPDLLTITLSEEVMKRALDRQAVRQKAGEEKNSDAPANAEKPEKSAEVEVTEQKTGPMRPWLGKSIALQMDRQVLELFQLIFSGRSEYQSHMQALAWSNIPILNEWKRLFPDRDPVEVHQRIWQSTLLCPGGGKYVWNEEFQTMESTVYGHPGQAKTSATVPALLATARLLDFGITFENNGLRAAIEISREPAAGAASTR